VNDTYYGTRAVRWAAGQTGAQELGALGKNSAGRIEGTAYAIDAVGNAVGFAEKWSGDLDLGPRPVLWNAGQTSATELGITGIDASAKAYSKALSISTTGNIAGVTGTSGGTYSGVRWMAGDTSGTLLGNLGTNLSGITTSYANGINAAGDAVGLSVKWSGNTSLNDRAVKWVSGQTAPIELGTLGTNASGTTTVLAQAINNAGDIAGWGLRYDGAPHSTGSRAIRWAAGKTAATELDTLGTDATGFGQAAAWGINGSGDIVGSATKYVNNISVHQSATLWRAGQVGVIDLNNLIDPSSGWLLEVANAISDNGSIVGYGQIDPDGAGPILTQTWAFRLTPSLPGDANDDGAVNFADLVAVAQHYGKPSAASWE